MGQAKLKAQVAEVTVAVCIPTIPRRRDMLKRALDSVAAQTRQPDEVIVVEDTEGRGAAPTRNEAWQQATSTYVAFLDDDDEFLPDHLEVSLRTLRRTRADLVYAWFELVGWDEATPDRPDPLATVCNGQLVHPLGVEFGPEQQRHYRRHAFIPITTVVRRSALERSGGFPIPGTPEWPRDDCEDWGGWLALLDTGARFAHVPKRTWRCYLGDGTAGRPWKG
jgi:Glycosyl transferase family 2